MKLISRLSIIALVLSIALFMVPVALAHPLGNFTINHYAGLLVSREAIGIDYVMDMAEIPAFQEIATFDSNKNGQPDPEETAGYAPAQCEKTRPDLDLRLDGRSLPLELVSASVEFLPGQGGLPTLRLSCSFRTSIQIPASRTVYVDFENRMHAARLGWQEIVVQGDGAALEGNFATSSPSARLTSYPKDLLSSPLDQRQVSFEARLSGAPSAPAAQPAARGSAAIPAGRNDAFTRLVLLDEVNLPTLLFALAVSFLWGAMHALTPGHGKTIVGAYLVGSRGTARHALYLGLTTTITHTAGVFALGLVTLLTARYILPEKLFPWLSLLSGLLVAAIGLNLLRGRLRSAKPRPAGLTVPERLGAYSLPASLPAQPVLRQVRLAVQPRGAAPLPLQAHEHIHTHMREAETMHTHRDGAVHTHDHDHAHGWHDHNHHSHLHAGHTHLPPGADGAPLTWRSLLALGISGGLLPCPSALVVLLSAIGLDRVGFGLVLVLAFSLGLAGVLTGIGLMFVYAGRLFDRFPAQGRLLRFVPAASALFIALVGLGIAARALVEMGFINRF